jgi:Uma2 family endonuclease
VADESDLGASSVRAGKSEKLEAKSEKRMAISSVPTKTQVVQYPESDGKPMTETDLHALVLIYLRSALDFHFRNDPNTYVPGNLMLYYEEGNPSASVSPDVFVVKGVAKKVRRVYKTWEEGKAPDVAIELTSRSTRLEDLGTKRALYAELGVTEYFLYDPYQEYLRPPLQGFHLDKGNYTPITADALGKLRSQILNLDLQIVKGDLRLFDPRAQKYLLTPLEAQETAAEVERLRAEIEKLRGKQ